MSPSIREMVKNQTVFGIAPEVSVREAAVLMKEHRIGALIAAAVRRGGPGLRQTMDRAGSGPGTGRVLSRPSGRAIKGSIKADLR